MKQHPRDLFRESKTAPSYLAGAGAGGALLASSVLVFLCLVISVSFNSWPSSNFSSSFGPLVTVDPPGEERSAPSVTRAPGSGSTAAGGAAAASVGAGPGERDRGNGRDRNITGRPDEGPRSPVDSPAPSQPVPPDPDAGDPDGGPGVGNADGNPGKHLGWLKGAGGNVSADSPPQTEGSQGGPGQSENAPGQAKKDG